MEKVNIRGIELLTAKNQAELVAYLLGEEIKVGKLIAINAEKVIKAEQNQALKTLLDEAEYKYADGISVVWAIRRKYPNIPKIERIAGADLWQALMKKAGEIGLPVFLVGASQDTLAKVAEKLAQWQVNIVGMQDGYFSAEQENAIIEQVKLSGAKLVTVAMGTPKQELFIRKLATQYPNALYMGVGGTYDVFVGKVKRAPMLWQKYGLEWLYRLLQQPTRWQRQLNLAKFAYYYWKKQL